MIVVFLRVEEDCSKNDIKDTGMVFVNENFVFIIIYL